MNRDEFGKHAIPALDGLYAYALRLVQNREDAADLVQETFLKALRRLDGFRETEAVRPMLFRILHNSFVDMWRKKKWRPRLVALSSPAELDGQDSAVMQALPFSAGGPVEDALSEDVAAALGALDDELRQTLWLREIEDFSYAEIAETMNAPIGTVRSRLSRARSQMAAQLQARRRGLRNTVSEFRKEGM